MSDPIERLTEIFEKFPGIGPRQAGRFVQFLLRSSPSTRRELIDAVQHLGGSVHQCQDCMRYHAGSTKLCSICSNPERDKKQLAVVASDADLAALERSGTYRGQYFVLGGTVDLRAEKTDRLRIKELKQRINDLQDNKDFSEIVLAFPANPEGDATAEMVREQLEQIVEERGIKITSLGRGLSTGSELEYADPDTIKNALDSRR